NAINNTKSELPEYTRAAVNNLVPRIKQNYSEITGQNRDRSFFYREAGISDIPRKTKFEQFAEFYFATATANRQSGKLIEAGFESCVTVVDQFLLKNRVRGFWEIEDSMSNAMVELRRAQVDGNFLRLVMVANRLETDIKELSRSLAISVGATN